MSPPSPSRIAARALAICAVVARAYLEEASADAHTEQLRKEIRGFVRELDCEDALREGERKLLDRPVGRLSQREQVDASWLCEGLAVLGWTLGRFELPLPDDHVDPKQVVDSLGFMRDEAAGSLRTVPTVRPPHELGLAQARLTLVRDRLRAFATEPGRVDLEALARGAELGELVLAGVPLAEGDLRIDGRPLNECPEERWREVLDAAEERCRAIAWICGGETYGFGAA